MHPRERLLYFFPKRSEFINKDLESLADHFDLHPHELEVASRILLPWRLMLQFLFLIRMRAWKHDAICHFAGYHSILPALLCRRCFIILAGSDAACFPNINYGNFRKYLYAKVTSFSLRKATLLLPVDSTLIRTKQAYDKEAPMDQGVLAFVPDLRTPFRTVHYGFDPRTWNTEPGTARDPLSFVCVASGVSPNNSTHQRKGIDILLRTAPLFPHLKFVVVGSHKPDLYQGLPANVTISRPMDANQLRLLFSESSFYLQASIMEGFPNALCEAMLCGCIPIVSNVAAMPRIIEDSGFIVEERSVQSLSTAIADALALDRSEKERRSILARELIMGKYSRRARLDALLEVVRSR